jgi:hypothetical protein
MATPTILEPIQQLISNQTFTGSHIRKPDVAFEAPKAAYAYDPKRVSEHWTDLSKAINEFMGGSERQKGSAMGMLGGNPLMYADDVDIDFDIAGGQIQHIIHGYMGGLGQLFDAAFGTAYEGVHGKRPEALSDWGKVPILSRFIRGSTYGAATRNAYYDVREAVKVAEKVVETSAKLGAKAHRQAAKENRPLLKMSAMVKHYDGQKSKFRRLRSKVEGTKGLDEWEKTQRVDELERKELELMIKVVKKARALGIGVS